MDDKTLIKVTNRNNGTTGYQLPDSHISRKWAVGQTKEISLGELREVSYIPGGEYILKNLLVIEDQAALKALNLEVEPEYFYDEKTVRDLLFGFDNMDAFLDFLDFAPEGAIEIAKQLAVDEEVPDVRKREALSKKTGFNINAAINLNKELDAEDDVPKEDKKERRVAPANKKAESAPAGRRTAAPKNPPLYKVVEK